MPRTIISALLTVYVCILSGCTLSPSQVTIVTSNSLRENPDIRIIKPGDEIFAAMNDTKWQYRAETNSNFQPTANFHVKYHPSYADKRWMVIQGMLENGNEYPVVLDTGASQHLFVNDIHIRQNNLAIQPFATGSFNPVGWGRCFLAELTIGNTTLVNWPCLYREQHIETRPHGIPIAGENPIIIGLGALRHFKYIAFDSIKQQVRFSFEQNFDPSDQQHWTKFPFVIEEDFTGNAFLITTLNIAGVETQLQLDTGSGRGLAVRRQAWQKIREKTGDIRLKEAKDLYPYIGYIPCRRGVIKKLDVAGRTIDNAHISVFGDDSPMLQEAQGLIGMQYFENTVLVLDFTKNLMWIKK